MQVCERQSERVACTLSLGLAVFQEELGSVLRAFLAEGCALQRLQVVYCATRLGRRSSCNVSALFVAELRSTSWG